jgi:hypothetical protein
MQLAICAVVLMGLGAHGVKPPAKELIATARAGSLDVAIKKHYVAYGKWPEILGEVAPNLQEGQKGMIDPWGTKYQFKIVTEKLGDGMVVERLYVWTERVVDKETKVYGNKPPVKKN